MSSWSIPRRIALGFLALSLVSLALGLLGLWSVVAINDSVVIMADNSMPSVVSLNRVVQQSLIAARAARRVVLDAVEDPRSSADAATALEGAVKAGDTLCAEYPRLVLDERDGQLFRSATAARDRLVGVTRDATSLVRDGKPEEAKSLLREKLDGAVQECLDRFNESIEYNTGKALEQVGVARARMRLSLLAIVAALASALLLAACLGTGIIRSASRALRALSDALEGNATQTAAAAGQLSAVSQAFAAGSSEQGSSVTQTSAALEEMSTMIRSTADNAAKAKELANQARTAAETGARTMGAMNDAMNAIEGSSAEVAKIVKNIDEIAFQTNILALNAAVEAARAGEAGAGFAVVADEVRSLAQRSAAAARETADKIDAAIANSRHGSASCLRVGESLTEIAGKVTAADELVAEIATAAREQTQGIKQIGVAMTQMDSITRSNAARAEETASAAAELNSQALLMQESVDLLRSLVASRDTRGKRVVRSASAPPKPAQPRLPAAAPRPKAAPAAPPAGVHIPMPGDAGVMHDEEDRHFRNF
jgi:methyl-accepting chemotaxis protein